jgi:CBS domain-containing protein
VAAEGKNVGQTHLRHVMTEEPDCLPPRHTAIDALRLMRDGGFRHVPVVHEGVLLGIVSRGDIRGLEPTLRSCICLHASCTVALGGSVSGF